MEIKKTNLKVTDRMELSIFIYEGKVQISFESGEKFELNKGGYLAFDARVKHNVIAEIQSKVLVTISESLK